MHSYAALLGHNPSISRAELCALIPDFSPGQIFGEFITFETAMELDQAFLSLLGGTIVLAKKIVGDNVFTLDDIPTILSTELKASAKKPVFSLRLEGVPSSLSHDLLRICKNHLKKLGMPSRYVGTEKLPPKAIQLHDEGLLDPKQGAELTILQSKENLWIGKTVAAHDVKEYTLRDVRKPVRDTTVGLLPPKLAQIMLNFGLFLANTDVKSKEQITVFDPFCGTGVVPLEAMIRGYNILASDLSAKAVSGSEKNIEWARKTYEILKKNVSSTVWKQDATKPFALKSLPTMVVTEGSLGPPLSKRPTMKEAMQHLRKSEELAAAFLQNCKATLPGVPVAIMLPVWYAQKSALMLSKIWTVIDSLGYRPVLPPHTSPMIEGHFSLLYRRPEQLVGREIVLLQPKK